MTVERTTSTGLEHFQATADGSAIVAALLRDGAVIVERLITQDQIERVLDETRDFREATPMGTDAFSGRNTRRTGSLVARSPAARELITHPVVLGVCDAVLGANAKSYQLHLTQVIDIGPGEPAQPLHRDQWAWDFFPFPEGFEVEISTIWAMQDFTEEIGATRVVPGSHRGAWDFGNPPPFEASVPAEMPAGSVVIYTGSVFHGGGANRTDQRRVAVNIDYCLGWLRQEENQYLSCPPEVARELPIELAKLIGYSRAAYALGYFGDVQDPLEALHPGSTTGHGFSPT